MREWRGATCLSAVRPVGIIVAALTALMAAAASPGPAYAADDTDKTLRPLNVERVEELAFGRIVGDERLPGQVVIDAVTGQKTVQGAAVDLGGEHRRAEYLVLGAPGHSFVITLPDEHSIEGKGKGGKDTALVKDFTSHPADVGRLGPDGRTTVYVGATFHLKPGQKGGDYQGPLDIFVSYGE